MPFSSCTFTFFIASFTDIRRPGGYIDHTEDEKSGLVRLLDEQLGPVITDAHAATAAGKPRPDDAWTVAQGLWDVRAELATWYRPNYDGFMVNRGTVAGIRELTHSSTLTARHNAVIPKS
jgi:hypothetical protein